MLWKYKEKRWFTLQINTCVPTVQLGHLFWASTHCYSFWLENLRKGHEGVGMCAEPDVTFMDLNRHRWAWEDFKRSYKSNWTELTAVGRRTMAKLTKVREPKSLRKGLCVEDSFGPPWLFRRWRAVETWKEIHVITSQFLVIPTFWYNLSFLCMRWTWRLASNECIATRVLRHHFQGMECKRLWFPPSSHPSSISSGSPDDTVSMVCLLHYRETQCVNNWRQPGQQPWRNWGLQSKSSPESCQPPHAWMEETLPIEPFFDWWPGHPAEARRDSAQST